MIGTLLDHKNEYSRLNCVCWVTDYEIKRDKQQHMVLVGAPCSQILYRWISMAASYRSNQPHTTTMFSPRGTRITVIQNLTVSAQPDVNL
jgi:hypothetical protein